MLKGKQDLCVASAAALVLLLPADGDIGVLAAIEVDPSSATWLPSI